MASGIWKPQIHHPHYITINMVGVIDFVTILLDARGEKIGRII